MSYPNILHRQNDTPVAIVGNAFSPPFPFLPHCFGLSIVAGSTTNRWII